MPGRSRRAKNGRPHRKGSSAKQSHGLTHSEDWVLSAQLIRLLAQTSEIQRPLRIADAHEIAGFLAWTVRQE
jgi:hypothetical protein